jgi:hypothetical protein
MSKTYYKVTNAYLKSFIVQIPEFITQYKIGEFVSSPIDGTPLAVFTSLSQARRWAGATGRIFECKIKNKSRKSWLPGRSFQTSLSPKINALLTAMRQKKKYLKFAITVLPRNTVTCKSVMLTREIYRTI